MQPTVAKGSDVISGSDLEDEFPFDLNDNYKSEKVPVLPFIPKEEEMSVEELERMLGERYKPVSGFVTCAEDGYEQKETCMCHLPWIQQSGKSNERLDLRDTQLYTLCKNLWTWTILELSCR
ncbi:hypothetical protein ACS0TY_000611 [Phlomoides rotata]